MSAKPERGSGVLGFLDPLARLFRGREEPASEVPETASPHDTLLSSFEAAIGELERKLEVKRREAETTRRASDPFAAPEDRAAQSLRRMEEAHRAIRADIEQMHEKLGTGLAGADLDELASYLEELNASAEEGKDTHSLLPRLRLAIARRLNQEAGELAVARLVALLQREGLSWPDPTRYRPSESPEEIERSRRRRLGEVREHFLVHDLERTAQRLLGIVRGWKSDYPDRNSPLWEECVLEGVAAGIRGEIVREATDLLRRDRDAILDSAQASIGKELGAIHSAMQDGVHSLEQAQRVAGSSMQALERIVPEIAWQHVRAELPHARGEYDS